MPPAKQNPIHIEHYLSYIVTIRWVISFFMLINNIIFKHSVTACLELQRFQ